MRIVQVHMSNSPMDHSAHDIYFIYAVNDSKVSVFFFIIMKNFLPTRYDFVFIFLKLGR